MQLRARRVLLVAALTGAAASISNAQTLTTSTPNNGSGGVFMNLTPASASLQVDSFETYFSSVAGTPVSVEVWTRPGSYTGFTASNAGWTLHATASGTSAGTTALGPLPLATPIQVPVGQTTAVYLHAITTGGGIRYNGTTAAPPQTTWSNADLTLFSDVSRTGAVSFAGTQFTPRTFSGVVHYSPSDPTATGACCFGNGTCQVITPANCSAQSGVFAGINVTCASANCPQPGRCCLFDGTCSVVLSNACAGTFTVGGNCSTACPSIPPVAYSNCNLSTGATTLSGVAAPAGSLWSEVARDENDPTTANTSAGQAGSGAFRLADDFVVGSGGLNLAFVKFPIYTTGATTVTTTAATVQIWNGPPNDPNSQVVFGDTTTNRLAHAEFSNIYRVFNTVAAAVCGGAPTAPGTTRRIQWAYISANTNLTPGTYWIDVGYTGGTFSPTATDADAIGRQCNPNNANSLQFNATWVPNMDAGQGCAAVPVAQDLYFELLGTTGGGCYANCDQSTSPPILNVADFTCFLQQFSAGNSYANCDGSTQAPVLNVADFTCFLQEFAAGCP